MKVRFTKRICNNCGDCVLLEKHLDIDFVPNKDMMFEDGDWSSGSISHITYNLKEKTFEIDTQTRYFLSREDITDIINQVYINNGWDIEK